MVLQEALSYEQTVARRPRGEVAQYARTVFTRGRSIEHFHDEHVIHCHDVIL